MPILDKGHVWTYSNPRMKETIAILRDAGIQPTPQRIMVAEYILHTAAHPTADMVWENVKQRFPTVSRATIYNTLNLFVEKKLIKQQILKEDFVVFDPQISDHHHFVDEKTGEIHDIPWEALKVTGQEQLKEFIIEECQVVMRGVRKNG